MTVGQLGRDKLEKDNDNRNFIKFGKNIRVIATGSIIAALLAIYFLLMWNFFPAFYSLQPAIAKGLPTLTEVILSSLSPGGSFDISVTGFNRGETTDIQIVSISFPNLTGNINFRDGNQYDGYIKIKNHNFSKVPYLSHQGISWDQGIQAAQRPLQRNILQLSFSVGLGKATLAIMPRLKSVLHLQTNSLYLLSRSRYLILATYPIILRMV